MKNNKKRGFTLVELLVVIAILAILSTVAVVGYTSFIERANVSNDENVANQLNKFLTALKADHTSEFYGDVINEDNIWEVTQEILKESGLNELEAQAGQYDYHFYFDLETGEYVVLKDKEAFDGLAARFMQMMVSANNSGYKKVPGNLFTKDNRYFLVDTKGYDVADAVNGFYKAKTVADYENLYAAINALDGGTIKTLISTYFTDTLIVANRQNFAADANFSNILFLHDAESIGNKTYVKFDAEGKDNPSTKVSADLTYTGTTVEIPEFVKHFEEDSLMFGTGVEVVINRTAEQVSKMAQGIFTNSKLVLVDGTFYAEILSDGVLEGVTNKLAGEDLVEYHFHYVNDLVSFGAMLSGDANKFQDVSISEGYMAWQEGAKVTINATAFVGADKNIPATGTDGIVWTSNTAGVTVNSNNEIIVDFAVADKTAPVEIVGTATNGVTLTYTLRFVYLTSFDYTIDGNSVAEKNTTGITLLYSADSTTGGKESFAVACVPGVYNVTNTTIEINLVPTLTSTSFKLENNAITVKSADFSGDDTVTLKTAGYEDKTIKLTLFNADSLVFNINNANIQFVADGNAITLGTLFGKNTGKTIPAGAEVWIMSAYGDTPFVFDPDQVRADKVTLDNTNWENTEIQFTDGQNNFTENNQSDFSVVIVVDGYRISADHKVSVVTGINVDSFEDLDGSKNNVLISNISDVPDDYEGFTFESGNTIYGNSFTIDLRGYDDTKTGVISLITLNDADLNNIKVVGNVYASSEFNFQSPETLDYGASLVHANDGSSIIDSYLANTRSPLVTDGTVTISGSTNSKTVIVGGNYANVDVKSGTLVLVGNVVTVNQMTTTSDNKASLGAGIVVDMFADANTSVDITSANLKQFNYVKQSEIASLPLAHFSLAGIEDVTVTMKEVLNGVYGNKAEFADCVYKDSQNTEYFNAGIIFLNGVQTEVYRSYMIDAFGYKYYSSYKESSIGALLSELGGSLKIVDGGGEHLDQTGSDYIMKVRTVQRGPIEKEFAIGVGVRFKLTIYANGYIWTPAATADNTGVNFNNDASDYIINFD